MKPVETVVVIGSNSFSGADFIDLVLGDDGKWRVIEIEAIEPYLFLDFAPEGARVVQLPAASAARKEILAALKQN